MSKVGQIMKFVKQIFDATTLHANAVSHCQYCSCKIDANEKMTVLEQPRFTIVESHKKFKIK